METDTSINNNINTNIIHTLAQWEQIKEHCPHRIIGKSFTGYKRDGKGEFHLAPQCYYVDRKTCGGYTGPCDYATCPLSVEDS